MNSISVEYSLVWRVKSMEHYQITRDGICFNVRSGRAIKKTHCGGSIGMCLGGRFRSLKWIKGRLERVPKKEILPF